MSRGDLRCKNIAEWRENVGSCQDRNTCDREIDLVRNNFGCRLATGWVTNWVEDHVVCTMKNNLHVQLGLFSMCITCLINETHTIK